MSNISMTRLLSEIKVLQQEEGRIKAAIDQCKDLAVVTRGGKPWKSVVVDPTEVMARVQSAEALIQRLITLRALRDTINATTTVHIGEVSCTITEALARKAALPYKKDLLARLQREATRLKSDQEKANDANETEYQRLTSVAEADIAVLEQRRSFVDQTFPIEIVDPVGLDKKIEALYLEIENFETNFDEAMSYVNATTMVEIPD